VADEENITEVVLWVATFSILCFFFHDVWADLPMTPENWSQNVLSLPKIVVQ
jgi:hypothetical protein